MRSIFQVLAFFFPRPFNVWLHRLAGAKIGPRVLIHPGVLILARHVEIGADAKIRFGAMISVRSFKFGEKSLFGYHIHVKGTSDLHVGAACVIGPKTIINCDCPVTIHYYAGVGPDCCLFTHGSFLPVSEGYRVSFGPIEIKSKAWVTMRSTIGPGVTVGEGTNVMPGTVLLESVGQHRLVSGNPVKLMNIPLIRNRERAADLAGLGKEILESFQTWMKEHGRGRVVFSNGALVVTRKGKPTRVTVEGDGDIRLLATEPPGVSGAYFNLATLRTDASRGPVKAALESFMRLHYGMTFLDE